MKSITKKITVRNKQGLHARPAALFVQMASRFDARITVSKDGEVVNGKSIMGILMLGATRGSDVLIEVAGDDAEEALLELEKLLTKDE